MAEITFESPPSPAQAPAPAADPNRPAWLPEGVNTPEELAKAYAAQTEELAKLRGTTQEPAKADEKPAEKPADEAPKDDAAKADEAAQKAAEASGVDFTPWQEEFAKTGDVAPESRAKIVEALRSQFGDQTESIVNEFIDAKKTSIEYAKVTAENETKALLEPVGGLEGWQTMAAWAAKGGMSADEIAAVNEQLESANRQTRALAVELLRTRYVAANGSAPKLVTATAASVGNDVFASMAQVQAAMQDPRYKNDEAYRSQVAAKLLRSKV